MSATIIEKLDLFNLCKELGIINQTVQPKDVRLENLRNLAKSHPAFKKKSKLDFLVHEFNQKFNMNIRLH